MVPNFNGRQKHYQGKKTRKLHTAAHFHRKEKGYSLEPPRWLANAPYRFDLENSFSHLPTAKGRRCNPTVLLDAMVYHGLCPGLVHGSVPISPPKWRAVSQYNPLREEYFHPSGMGHGTLR